MLVGSFALGSGHSTVPAVVASVSSATPSAAPIADHPTTATTTATAAAASETPITVTLVAYPPRAALYLDGGPPLPNPYRLSVPADSKPHQVRASAPGFNDRTEELRLDGDKEVRLTLSALAAGGGARAPLAKPKGSAEPTHTTAPTPTSGDLPKVVTRRPRVLDPDNPFAAP
jgi:hypothetical protein